MKRLAILSLLFCALGYSANSQTTLFTEDFGSGCNQGQLVGSYSSPNGAWTVTETGFNAEASSQWYVSATENGNDAGACGSGCGEDRSLHISSITVLGIPADQGALYYEGLTGFCDFFPCGSTSRRVESPIIDCSNATSITLDFVYLEGGNTFDNATVWYFDGASWTELLDTEKTFSPTCAPQGIWTAISLELPASADNNADVRIGFEWVNNDDGDATDPSFAVDDILVSGIVNDDPGTDCPGDFDNDGIVSTSDLLLILNEFGCLSDCTVSMDDNDNVVTDDLLLFLDVFGNICPD